MGELAITGRLTVKGLKAKFLQEYNLTLRIYKGSKFADENATLASLSDKKVEDFSAKSNMLIGNFEQRFEAATGLKVQVSTPDDSVLVNNSAPLSSGKTAFKKK